MSAYDSYAVFSHTLPYTVVVWIASVLRQFDLFEPARQKTEIKVC